MAKALYMDDSYMKEFDAKVTDADGKNIELDQTAFYPESGGQPADHGKLVKEGVEYMVLHTKKDKGRIVHEVDREGLSVGDEVHGVIDWERRYRLMRSHTAAHVVSGMFSKTTEAKITGNQLGLDKIRIDFNLENFDREVIESLITRSNELIHKNLDIKAYGMPREEVEKNPDMVKLAAGLPPGIKVLRIVEIDGFDSQPDGGTHVRNTSEVGELEILKMENKGASNRRVYIRLKE
ncbi:alanyl-tRNA editing protein [Candidatus Woesearchaeota archaeon]|nr:alanyl-tRNA editing protein [Candidatus Woesearchaeota archaeon]